MSLPAQPSPGNRWLAFAVLCAMQMMVVVDISIVTVSLRSIQSDLGFPEARLAWITNAYTIGFGGLLLLSGRLGDLIGRKRMFVSGLSLFTVASALCGAAQNQEMLIAMRFLQGAGAAMAHAVIMGIIFTIFTNPAELGKAMGISGFGQAAGASLGIIAGGLLTDGVNWHWVFYINVPIGLAALVIAVRSIPSDRGMGLDKGADFLGAALVTSGMMLAVYTIATVAEYGWASGHTLGFGIGAVVLLSAFVGRAATAAQPLVPLGIFRSRNLSGANTVHFLLVGGTMSFNILIALYMQQVAGYSPAETGFAYLPLAVAAGACSVALSARLNMRFGLRTVMIGSLALVAAGLLLALRTPTDPAYALDILPTAVLLGAGSGLAMPAVIMMSMQVRSPSEAGLASGLAGSAGTIGDSLGIAALTAIAAAHTQSALDGGTDAKTALTDGFHLSFGVAAALVVAAIAVAVTVLREVPMGPPPGAGGPDGPGVEAMPGTADAPGVPSVTDPEGARP
ncbi:MFS transporter [Streptomyces cyanogenus]|uniref:MFS-type transporter EfpA n=1 Tax=Streptomyces cyanogenus TaxID=80860 RepID=A0ABX7TI02_STRCY|nr:MFS transporter [Streptomyces cyanogenus]QTD95922.1 putative MFS-type transporter EfpA [Streptomyces cyanogenus]